METEKRNYRKKSMMKAIETIYKGYKFRSRLEARWAVFFDALGIKWEYEKEGYDLDGICYLPDFWLPDLQRWVEIKGQRPTNEELTKIELLEQITGYPSCLFYGLPGENYGWAYFTCAHDGGGGKSFSDNVLWKSCYMCQKIDMNIRHHDDCSLYSEIAGIELNSSSCNCTIDDFKSYQRKRIYEGGPEQLRSKCQWQQYRNKPYEEYVEPTEEEFKEAAEKFIGELVHDLFPCGFINRDWDMRLFALRFDHLDHAYDAARQARFEHRKT